MSWCCASAKPGRKRARRDAAPPRGRAGSDERGSRPGLVAHAGDPFERAVFVESQQQQQPAPQKHVAVTIVQQAALDPADIDLAPARPPSHQRRETAGEEQPPPAAVAAAAPLPAPVPPPTGPPPPPGPSGGAAEDPWQPKEPVDLGTLFEADRSDILGRGTFGVVVRGVERSSGRRLAVKMIALPSSLEGAGGGAEEVDDDYDSVRREAVIAGALRHRNIARVLASVHHPDDVSPLHTMGGTKSPTPGVGTLYLIQQLAEGRDMFWLWWESPGRVLSEDRACFYFAQLCGEGCLPVGDLLFL
jgi:hypothetical protein